MHHKRRGRGPIGGRYADRTIFNPPESPGDDYLLRTVGRNGVWKETLIVGSVATQIRGATITIDKPRDPLDSGARWIHHHKLSLPAIAHHKVRNDLCLLRRSDGKINHWQRGNKYVTRIP